MPSFNARRALFQAIRWQRLRGNVSKWGAIIALILVALAGFGFYHRSRSESAAREQHRHVAKIMAENSVKPVQAGVSKEPMAKPTQPAAVPPRAEAEATPEERTVDVSHQDDPGSAVPISKPVMPARPGIPAPTSAVPSAPSTPSAPFGSSAFPVSPPAAFPSAPSVPSTPSAPSSPFAPSAPNSPSATPLRTMSHDPSVTFAPAPLPRPEASASAPAAPAVDSPRLAKDKPAVKGTDHTEAAISAQADRMTDGRLKVQAIVWSPTAEDRMAVINNRIVREGAVMEGFSIVEIEQDNVFAKEGEHLWRIPFGKP